MNTEFQRVFQHVLSLRRCLFILIDFFVTYFRRTDLETFRTQVLYFNLLRQRELPRYQRTAIVLLLTLSSLTFELRCRTCRL